MDNSTKATVVADAQAAALTNYLYAVKQSGRGSPATNALVDHDTVSFVLTPTATSATVQAVGEVGMKTPFIGVFTQRFANTKTGSMPVLNKSSENPSGIIAAGGPNLEVSVMIDITGSIEKAARDLARASSRVIVQLGFKKADFQVQLVPLTELGPQGDCGVEFIFSPNIGEPALPLHRIASSGELARVMLALKTVLAEIDDVPLLVFDEVDANVGGEIGRIVGGKMADIAERHQVLCVTHLPQVAAQARNHFVVTKDQSGDRASVGIEAIHADRKQRISELARMLGDRSAKSAQAHAEELLAK